MIKFVLIILGILVLFFLIVMLLDTNRFVIKEYKLATDKTKHKYRFVILADLHGKEYGKNNEKLIAAINKANPDGILIAGDMLTAKSGKEFNHVLQFLNVLNKKYPVFYGNGNHEYRLKIYPQTYGDMGMEYEQGLQKIGIFPLCNESTIWNNDNVAIYGLEIDREYYKRFQKKKMSVDYLNETLGVPDRSKYNILLAHNPAYFEEYAAWGADLVVSGHVHGGIMRLPFLGGVIAPSLELFPKYSGGMYKLPLATQRDDIELSSTMILSNGLGSHTIPVRIFNPAQLVVLELDSE